MTTGGTQPPSLPAPVSPPAQQPPSGGWSGGMKLVIIIVACIGGSVIVVGILVAMLLPSLSRARDKAVLTTCQAHLKTISLGLLTYQQDNSSAPLIKMYEAAPNGANSAPTADSQTDEPFSSGQWGAVLGDQAMQNVWLWITAEGYVDEDIFKCPGDPDWQPRDAAGRYGWTDPHQYSYGMQWPYATDADGNGNPAPLSAATYRPGIVIFADQNPGGPVGGSRSPSNHPKVGTNYLLADGAVLASRDGTSTFNGDDIYTNEDGLAGGLPQSEDDTSITLSGR